MLFFSFKMPSGTYFTTFEKLLALSIMGELFREGIPTWNQTAEDQARKRAEILGILERPDDVLYYATQVPWDLVKTECSFTPRDPEPEAFIWSEFSCAFEMIGDVNAPKS